jgi:hypothetical protein
MIAGGFVRDAGRASRLAVAAVTTSFAIAAFTLERVLRHGPQQDKILGD